MVFIFYGYVQILTNLVILYVIQKNVIRRYLKLFVIPYIIVYYLQ